eukprot:Lankesteria_metandrocarpae@DN2581_c0_g1_i1.p1
MTAVDGTVSTDSSSGVYVEKLEVDASVHGNTVVAVDIQPHHTNAWSKERFATASGTLVQVWVSTLAPTAYTAGSTSVDGDDDELRNAPTDSTTGVATAEAVLLSESNRELTSAVCVASLDEHVPNYVVTLRWSPSGQYL